jgi:hypothetical protein
MFDDEPEQGGTAAAASETTEGKCISSATATTAASDHKHSEDNRGEDGEEDESDFRPGSICNEDLCEADEDDAHSNSSVETWSLTSVQEDIEKLTNAASFTSLDAIQTLGRLAEQREAL